MILNIAILITLLCVLMILWSRRVHGHRTWRAMTTPLASIIGSGFLVLGPILENAYGEYAPLAMAGLCLLAYLFGGAIRYNMAAIERTGGDRGATVEGLETMASWALGFAYIISVAYYLNLFGAFGVSMAPVHVPNDAKLLTTAIFGIILFVGWTRGFRMLENLEYVSVAAKLAIIAGFLMGLGFFVFGRLTDGGLTFTAPSVGAWEGLVLGFGLIVTVQGFETSRYLASEYDTRTRIRSMQWAQWLSAAIYVVYIVLLAYSFGDTKVAFSETAIIGMMHLVAPILPALLVAAALAAQFSAAVADTSGSGGLFADLTKGRVSPRQAYALLAVVGLGLTWTVNVFEIISFASRAFAGYYALQAAIAAVTAWQTGDRAWRPVLFGALALVGLAILIFGQPVEG